MDDQGIEFEIHVRPGASRRCLDGVHNGVLAVRVSAPPADGQANDAVRDVLAAAFGVRRSAVTIVRGSSSRRKQIRVEGDTAKLRLVYELLLA